MHTRNDLLFALKLDKCNCIDNKKIALCKSSGSNSELLRFSGSRQSVFEVCLVCSRSMLPSSLHSIAHQCRLTHKKKTLKLCSKKLCVCKLYRVRFRAGFNLHGPQGINICITMPCSTHGLSMSVLSVYRQLSQGRMANFPAFIASKSFDLCHCHMPQIK